MKTFQKPLTPEEEKYYLQQYKQGSLEAKNILIERNLRLVAHIVKKYQGAVEELDDLISIGTIGLIKAIHTFDAGKASRLSTYAARCIDNAILSPIHLWLQNPYHRISKGQNGSFEQVSKSIYIFCSTPDTCFCLAFMTVAIQSNSKI